MTLSDRVLDLVRDESFDIILLGHNSSDAVSGIQLLEEARFRGYMRPTGRLDLHDLRCFPGADTARHR